MGCYHTRMLNKHTAQYQTHGIDTQLTNTIKTINVLESQINNTITSIVDISNRVNTLECVIAQAHQDHLANEYSCCQHMVVMLVILIVSYHLVFTFGIDLPRYRSVSLKY